MAAKPEVPPELLTEQVHITYSCNNRCIFCMNAGKKGGASPSDIMSFLERSGSGKIERVLLTGGEPAMHPDLLGICSLLTDAGYRIGLLSNLRKFSDPKFTAEVLKYNVDRIYTSIHGHTPALHDLHANSKGAFADLAAALKNLAEYGIPVGTNTVMTRYNLSKLREIASFILEIPNIATIKFGFPLIVGRALENRRCIPSFSQARRKLVPALELVSSSGVLGYYENLPFCAVPGYPQCKIEAYQKNYEDVHIGGNNLQRADPQGIFCKANPCLVCSLCSACEGPQRRYVELYGLDGIEPRLPDAGARQF